MKILVLSDSHSSLIFMRSAILAVKPDAVVHLGDYYGDAETLEVENPHLRFHMVAGNCDSERTYRILPQLLCYDVCGVRLYMVHGHNQQVKKTMFFLLSDARKNMAQAALFGHTHEPVCWQEDDGLWVMNPGSCISYGGSVGLIETENGKITACRILRQADLETFV